MNRVHLCDIIIDQIKPEIDGRPFGSWCSLAVESAALGKVTIANDLWVKDYEAEYGRPPGITLANTLGELEEVMCRLVSMTPDEVTSVQMDTLSWVNECHGLKETGERLVDRVLTPILDPAMSGAA